MPVTLAAQVRRTSRAFRNFHHPAVDDPATQVHPAAGLAAMLTILLHTQKMRPRREQGEFGAKLINISRYRARAQQVTLVIAG